MYNSKLKLFKVNMKQNTTFYKTNEYSLYAEFWLSKLQ